MSRVLCGCPPSVRPTREGAEESGRTARSVLLLLLADGRDQAHAPTGGRVASTRLEGPACPRLFKDRPRLAIARRRDLGDVAHDAWHGIGPVPELLQLLGGP